MKNYNNFISEKLNDKQQKYINLIIDYLNKNTNYNLYEYNEEFEVIKSEKYISKLYFIPDLGKKAIRFNFKDNFLRSIDLWKNFKFDNFKITTKPDYTLTLKQTILDALDDIKEFIDEDFTINENSTEVEQPENETVKLKSINEKVFESEIDIFETVKLYTAQVAFGVSNSLIISGKPGLGKTFDVLEMLDTLRTPYIHIKSDISTSGLYEILFLNREKLLVFDDCDSVWGSVESENILKAALDTSKVRQVARVIKTHFDSFGLSDSAIQQIYDETGKLPKQFEFRGRVIFITNVPGEDIDKAILSRSLHVDIDPPKDKVIARIEKILHLLGGAKVDINIKRGVLDFMIELDDKFDMRFDLNFRTFVHCLNIRLANEFDMDVGGEKLPTWKMLIKQYLVT